MSLRDMAVFYAEFMQGLKNQMRIPAKRPVRVLIIDDSEVAVAGMRTLLGHWNNLGLLTVIQSDGQMPPLDLESDIVLLDEQLDGLTGAQVTEQLRSSSYCGMIASIGQGDESPNDFKTHFGHKACVGSDIKETERFIKFMNGLIETVLRDRME
ncbi:MAG: hypothetical protein NTW66_02795 [Candidatus Magasanikbacteria bacterium]|nr:hypothetical protein [Candidatus Magasanikbacteria bacterium]